MSQPTSPFQAAPPEPAVAPQESPFAKVDADAALAALRAASPFAMVDSPAPAGKVPEARKATVSPFQLADPAEGYGFEATPTASPAPASSPSFPAASSPSPFDAPVANPPASPFAQTPAPPLPAAPAFATTPAFTPAPSTSVASVPAAEAASNGLVLESSQIRQLELRAIFGVDREMDVEEILQRSRGLPGIRNIARVSTQDLAAVEAVKSLVTRLGFTGGPIRIFAGTAPLEFIREGSVLLAVQTQGGFAPGVRETLILVARELGRMA
jgi:hypothetical protein